jgi:hypothetical protein
LSAFVASIAIMAWQPDVDGRRLLRLLVVLGVIVLTLVV